VASFGINYMALLQMALFPILAFASVVALDAQRATVPVSQPSEEPQFVGRAYMPIGEARQ